MDTLQWTNQLPHQWPVCTKPLVPSCEISVSIWETLYISSSWDTARMAEVGSGWIIQAAGWADGFMADGLVEYEASRCPQIGSRSAGNHRIARQPCHCPQIVHIAHTLPILVTYLLHIALTLCFHCPCCHLRNQLSELGQIASFIFQTACAPKPRKVLTSGQEYWEMCHHRIESVQ